MSGNPKRYHKSLLFVRFSTQAARKNRLLGEKPCTQKQKLKSLYRSESTFSLPLLHPESPLRGAASALDTLSIVLQEPQRLRSVLQMFFGFGVGRLRYGRYRHAEVANVYIYIYTHGFIIS